MILCARRYRNENKISQPTPFALICLHLINAKGFYFKEAVIDRMQKLVDFGILDYQLVKKGGTFSFYAFGKNFKLLCGLGGKNNG